MLTTSFRVCFIDRISRDDTTLDSKFHFFTSHFFSRLSEDGPEAVASWTRRKNINIFEKKFVFIPINKSMHWSLCLIVNPGAIVEGGDRERTKDDPLSCMIFMDSLRMHNKKHVAETIRNWLNSEWKRMYQDILLDKSAGTGDGPFNSDNFKIFSPRGTFFGSMIMESLLQLVSSLMMDSFPCGYSTVAE